METAGVLKALAALSQESRLAVFRLLVQTGTQGRIVGEIAEKLDLANATLSFHLKELANAGLIEGRQEGRRIFYSANYQRMNELMAYLTENCCAGDGVVCLTPRRTKCTPVRPLKQHKSNSTVGVKTAKRR